MARVREIRKREDIAPVYRKLFDELAESRGGEPSGPFRVLLHSPVPAQRAAQLGAYFRFEHALPEKVISIAAITVGRETDCVFEYTAQEEGARRNGVREEAINAIKHRKAPTGLVGDELLVWTFTTELLRKHRVSEPTWKAAMDRFGLKPLTDLVGAIGYYTYISIAMNAFETDTRPDREPTLPLP
ncbi:MAG: carboxymuconolactone decarboxylase family protein [Chloroflexi bacterium]|nr:carboxymuconolactone decarboxylase family protein [Chloroflexota bacterium]